MPASSVTTEHVPREHLPLGSAATEVQQLRARNRELELLLALAERCLQAQRSTRGDADEVLDRIGKALGPRGPR